MDTNSLVTEGSELVRLLDGSKAKPRVAMWAYNSEADRWKLWVVPSGALTDKHEFYRLLADIITKNRQTLPSLDISDIEFKADNHPAVEGLSQTLRVEGVGNAYISNTMLNGFYLPDGIVLRLAV